jgi:glutamyl-tRNA synthetase
MPVARRGRLAPTPTGLLHVGHARTFALAAERAGPAGLVMRIEDLDGPRCRPEYAAAALDDLRWLGLAWNEGPDVGGPHAPYVQSERAAWYLEIWRQLEATGLIYPSPHSRRDVEAAATAPHEQERGHPPFLKTSGEPAAKPQPKKGDVPFLSAEPIFPPALRPAQRERAGAPGGVPWRFRVPDGRVIEFQDGLCGTVTRTAGIDFGDFVVWRRDDLAAYELAVVADDHGMAIEEVVRGADLLTSTARQLLLYEALGWSPPGFAHAPLVRDAAGRRLAKRSGGLAIRDLRAAGWTPAEVLKKPIPAAVSPGS